MYDKKTLLLAQVLITFMMATSVSGIMSVLALGPTLEWLQAWPRLMATAWPIAFVLTMFVSKIGFGLAARICGRKPVAGE
ncbi:MAG: DUF2798 domain-containing protein [Hydrogenophaga sp.]|nr:DUF2798 domain-containing protein [Hydrogenophaga sp.]